MLLEEFGGLGKWTIPYDFNYANSGVAYSLASLFSETFGGGSRDIMRRHLLQISEHPGMGGNFLWCE
jgi:hypothetical protein